MKTLGLHAGVGALLWLGLHDPQKESVAWQGAARVAAKE